jgi:hypothetical protein
MIRFCLYMFTLHTNTIQNSYVNYCAYSLYAVFVILYICNINKQEGTCHASEAVFKEKHGV